MKGRFYTVIYSAVLGTVCALLLTAAAEFTAPYEAANKEAEEVMKSKCATLKSSLYRLQRKEYCLSKDGRSLNFNDGELQKLFWARGQENSRIL